MKVRDIESNEKVKNSVRAPRFSLGHDLIVTARTIGTSLSYKLATDDVSKSGLLLSWDYNTKVPFIENTLIEMDVDVEGSWLQKPLHCIGKIVRHQPSGDVVKFGVAIVQMDQKSFIQWDMCLREIEESSSCELIPASA